MTLLMVVAVTVNRWARTGPGSEKRRASRVIAARSLRVRTALRPVPAAARLAPLVQARLTLGVVGDAELGGQCVPLRGGQPGQGGGLQPGAVRAWPACGRRVRAAAAGMGRCGVVKSARGAVPVSSKI